MLRKGTLAPPADVRNYGAKGDGTTDDTAAIQAALNAYSQVYLPAGTYLVSTLNLNAGQRLYGDGQGATTLKSKASATGNLLNCAENAVQIEDLSLDGTGSGANRAGILIAALARSSVRRCAISNFNLRGIDVEQSTRPGAGTNLVISDCWLTSNTVGLYIAVNAEYLRVVNCGFRSNTNEAIYDLAGNASIVGCHVTANGTGVRVSGVGSTNNAHGVISGCLINHNTTYNLFFESVTIGHMVTGCALFEGPIYCKSSSVILILGCHLDVSSYYLQGGTQIFKDCLCHQGYGNSIVQNYQGTPDTTYFVNCRNFDGTMFAPSGTPNQAVLWDGSILKADTVQAAATAGDLLLKPDPGTGLVQGGRIQFHGSQGNSGSWTGANFTASIAKVLSCADAANLRIPSGQSFGFTAMASLHSKGSNRVILAKWLTSSGSNLEYLLWYNTTSDRFQFQVGNGTSGNVFSCDTLGSPALDTMYFFRCWFDAAANTLNVEINGVRQTPPLAMSGTPLVGTRMFGLGRVPNAASSPWDGVIGPVGYWSGVIPPATVFNAGNPKLFASLTAGEKSGLSSWWDNGEASGTHADSQDSNALTNTGSVASASGPAFTYYTQGAVLRFTPGGQLQWVRATDVQTTVGAAGGASALPATPTRYLKVGDTDGTVLVVPAYAAS